MLLGFRSLRRQIPGIGLLRLFLIIRIFDTIPLIVARAMADLPSVRNHPRPARNQYPLLRLRLRRAMIVTPSNSSLGKAVKAEWRYLLPRIYCHTTIITRKSFNCK